MKDMTDYELVKRVQSFATECPSKGRWLGVLYNRYLPMINKHAAQLFQKFPDRSELYGDFLQDAYFAVKRAAEGVDDRKVGPEWKFSSVLWYWLQKLRTRYRRYFFYHGPNREFSIDEAIPHKGIDSPRQHQKHGMVPTVDLHHYTPYTERFSQEQAQFFGQLTEEEQSILAFRRQGLTLMEIARRTKRSYPFIQQHVARAKQLAGDVFEVAYK